MKTKSSVISILFLAICIFGLIAGAPVRATDYFVDVVNGSDNDDGTSIGTAWQTIEAAVPRLADNDRLNVAPGTYVPVYTSGNGAVDVIQNGVTIQGAPGVVIDGGGSDGPCWGTGFYISGSGVVLRDLEIKRFACDGTKAVRVQSGSNNRIESCVISNSDDGIVFETGSGTGNVVEDCTIFETLTGVDIQDASPQILRNTIYDNSTGINIAEYSGQTIQPTIANNLIFNTGTGTVMNYGIYIRAFSTGSTVSPLIYHNTINGVTQDGIYIEQEYPTNPVVDIKYNNITYHNGFGVNYVSGGVPDVDYNCFWGNTGGDVSGVTPGGNNKYQAPLYRNYPANDFRLQADSPCFNAIPLDAGDTVTIDIDLAPRPQGTGYDMGAYETLLPIVLSVSPSDGAMGVAVNQTITVTFTQDMDQSTFDSATFIVKSDAGVVTGSVVVNGSTAVFTPLSSLNYLATYTVLVTDGVQNVNGDPLETNFSWSFTTEGSASQGASFPTQTVISTSALTAFSVYAADIDDDGDLDVLSASDDDNTVAWYANADGSGTFGAENVISTSALGARAVFARDIDGDGDMDVVSAAWDGYEVIWHRNEPVGTFGTYQVRSHINPVGVYAVDLDNDGDTDVLSASYGDDIIAWYENLDGVGDTWTEHTITVLADGAWDVFPADLDNDGDLDVLSAANWGNDENNNINENGVAWYENRLNEVSNDFGPQQVISAAANGARVVRAADMDQDGDMDVISASWFDGKIAWYPNLGGTFGNPASNQNIIATANVFTQAMHVADLDNDGDVDVLYASWRDDTGGTGEHKIVWMENLNTNGTAWASHDISTQIIGCQSLYTADLDGDGDLDVLSASQDDNKIAWYENKGGTTNKPPSPPPINGPEDEANFGELDPIDLDGGTYSDPESDRHDLTYFQVRRADSGELVLDETLSGGVTTYTISPGTIPSGLKYNWRVGYVDEFGLESWSEWHAFKIGTLVVETLPGIRAGTGMANYGMISIVHWPYDPSPQAVFNIDYDPRNYRIGTYDALTGRYIEFGEGLEMEPGRSYWILARDGLTVNFNGIPVSLATDVYVSLDYNPTTENGYNMVAPPNNADYYWSDVMVAVDDGQNLTIVDAIQYLADDNPYIDKRLWRWENGGYKSDTPDTDATQVMAAYKGYWVRAKQADVFLRFDPGTQLSSLGHTETLVAKAWQKAKPWLSRLNIFSRQALADNDSPPMPMAALDENTVDPVFQGCFVEAINHKP